LSRNVVAACKIDDDEPLCTTTEMILSTCGFTLASEARPMKPAMPNMCSPLSNGDLYLAGRATSCLTHWPTAVKSLSDVIPRTSKLIGPADAAHAIAELLCEVKRMGWIMSDGAIYNRPTE